MMMPLDICIESYGAAVYVVDSLLSTGLFLPSKQAFGAPDVHEVSSLDEAVTSAADRLGFSEAQALWLVDVCQCSYDDAAAEAGTTRDEIADRVAQGRRAIRDDLPLVPAGAWQ